MKYDGVTKDLGAACWASRVFNFLKRTAMADIQQLLSVLDVFGRAPDRDGLEKANAWLQDFQHSVRNKFSALGHRHA